MKTLDVHALGAKHLWAPVAMHRDAARVRAVPFEAVEIELGVLWG